MQYRIKSDSLLKKVSTPKYILAKVIGLEYWERSRNNKTSDAMMKMKQTTSRVTFKEVHRCCVMTPSSTEQSFYCFVCLEEFVWESHSLSGPKTQFLESGRTRQIFWTFSDDTKSTKIKDFRGYDNHPSCRV